MREYVQLDIMDGIFVPSKSLGIEEVKDWRPKVGLEAHLMVVDPLVWIKPLAKIGVKKFIYHFEANNDHGQVIRAIESEGMIPAIAVNPATVIDDFSNLVDRVESVLFMSVHPGFYGAAFIPEVLDKIRTFKQMFPAKTICIDGGIKLDNVVQVRHAGVDCICVGSAILKSQNPRRAYEDFKQAIYG